MLEEIRPAELKVKKPWIMPNVKIYRNPLTGSMIVAGGLGIQEELVDAVFPTLYPTKKQEILRSRGEYNAHRKM